MTHYCPRCGKPVEKKAANCPSCGQKFDMFCLPNSGIIVFIVYPLMILGGIAIAFDPNPNILTYLLSGALTLGGIGMLYKVIRNRKNECI